MHTMKRLLLPLAVFAFACQTTTPPAPAAAPDANTASKATEKHSAHVGHLSPLIVAPDVEHRLAQLPRTVVAYDLTQLSESDRAVVAKLVEASKEIDEIFWRQVSEENPKWRETLAVASGAPVVMAVRPSEAAFPGGTGFPQGPSSVQRGPDISAAEIGERSRNASQSQAPLRAAYELFIANKGPWDRLKSDEPFIGTTKKPEGAGFYPADMTKEELEKYLAAHPNQKDELTGLFTVVRRDGVNFVGVPYSSYYRDFLRPAAARLKEAAALTSDESLKTFLNKRAEALLNDDYRDSDMAWMDLNGSLEVVIGPYEVYEDNLFNYKASYEAFICAVDAPESQKLARYAKALPDMERNLPEPEEYRNPNRGSDSPIKVVQELYTAGDARRGVQTAAFNLPNDEVVREKKGSKKVLLKNVINAKYRQSGEPIAHRVLDDSQVAMLSFDAFFDQILFHELSHGLGPGLIAGPDGKRIEARIPLKNLYSTIEESKADVLGLWNIAYAQKHNLLSGYDENQLYVTYAGLLFRSLRFGIGEAHGRGSALQWNWLREKGGINPNSNGRYTVDFAKFREGVKSLATELLTIEATGDYNRANTLLTKYAVETDEMKSVNKKLADIPVDITPVFPAAGEK